MVQMERYIYTENLKKSTALQKNNNEIDINREKSYKSRKIEY